ncbi:MAG: ABC transporter ATP-binding protein [Clostridiales bacterium]|nr:ABC transporter ATP-binding protein [Clostridiales bacterium]
MEDFVVYMKDITKSFPGIKACDNISLGLKRGEIHALLGENGAGKSTLMSILFGLYSADNGQIFINGKEQVIRNPNDANALGIGMVHQHFRLVECFSVLENIILGNEPQKFGFLEKKEAREKVLKLSRDYGLEIEPDKLIEDATVGMQQRTEILKMLYRDNDILIFDEPTAVLTPQEIRELMAMMKKMCAEGKSILFITHKLAEIMSVADRVTVLRKGQSMGTVNVKDSSKEELSRMMLGRDIEFKVTKKEAELGDVVLKLEYLSVLSGEHKRDAVKSVSFEVRAGEIVCIAGIDGNGQTELIHGISGLSPISGGRIELCGEDISRSKIRERSKLGMSHIPEDRHKHGLILDFQLQQNLVLQTYWTEDFQKNGFLQFDNVREFSDRLIEQYDIRSGRGSDSIVRKMSGGNQQKAIIAREVDKDPRLLLAVQPTRGLDVGAIEFIHKKLIERRDKGDAVLMVSLELEEVISLPDRILVMYEGEIVADLDPDKVSMEELGLYMAGAKRMEGF